MWATTCINLSQNSKVKIQKVAYGAIFIFYGNNIRPMFTINFIILTALNQRTIPHEAVVTFLIGHTFI